MWYQVDGDYDEYLLYFDNYNIMILDLLNKIQEFKSLNSNIQMWQINVLEINKQIEDNKKAIEILEENKNKIINETENIHNDFILVEEQVKVLYELTKAEYTQFAKFDNADTDYLDKIKKEQETIRRLNLVEDILWIEKTLIPQRTITLKSEISPVEEKVCETTDNCSPN